MNLFIKSASDLNLYLKGIVIDLIKQNIVYADVIISLPELVAQGIEIPEILAQLGRYNEIKNIKINWWIDLVRHSGAENAVNLLKTVVQCDVQNTITGINLGGDEKAETLVSFEPVFNLARKNNLKINLHDGETQIVANQEKYVEYGVNRIAHGLCYIQEGICQNFLIGPAFFCGFSLGAFSGFFCAGALGFGAAALSLSSFGGRPRRFGCSGSLGFSCFPSAFFGASGCFSGFSGFAGAGFSPPKAAARSSAFFPFKNTARSLVWAVLCVRLAVHY